ncbi:MAG: hypothetical protein JWM11_2980 [Planctomycetaceae bacterium]|nr:hypothetical protein [Planctomycetaceae bacterium]
MTPETTIDGSTPTNRYRLPGIEREGIAQLSLLETALWPLQGGILLSPVFETSYGFTTPAGREMAHVTVRSALGLQPIDEFVLWGLLGATLRKPQADPLLLATPYWMLRHLGLATGGYQYGELRGSLLRLATTSYQNTGFYNPETQEHENVAFQFLSMFLPTVGGTGERVDNDRCWRIEWNPAFFRFCQMTGGNLLFDLDLYQDLTPASRRLFLKLKDRFWRSKKVFFNVDDLTINGLGFAASRPLYKRKFDLLNCIHELLQHGVIELGKGQTDPKDLFLKRGKGSYVVTLFQGEYFRLPLAGRTTSEKNAISDDPLYEPLRTIGIDQAGIRRIFETKTRGLIKKWVSITDAAMHEKPKGFPGFKVSPAAFFMDAVQNDRLPPDWVYAHEKKVEQDQWERNKAAFAKTEQECLRRYNEARTAGLRAYLASDEGRAKFKQTYESLLELTKRTEPERYQQAAHDATVARIEKLDFQFPEYAVWVLSQENAKEKSTA